MRARILIIDGDVFVDVVPGIPEDRGEVGLPSLLACDLVKTPQSESDSVPQSFNRTHRGRRQTAIRIRPWNRPVWANVTTAWKCSEI